MKSSPEPETERLLPCESSKYYELLSDSDYTTGLGGPQMLTLLCETFIIFDISLQATNARHGSPRWRHSLSYYIEICIQIKNVNEVNRNVL